jgi:hypothetical protein
MRLFASLIVGGFAFYFLNIMIQGLNGELSTPGVYFLAMLSIFSFIPAIILFRSGISLIMDQQKRRF